MLGPGPPIFANSTSFGVFGSVSKTQVLSWMPQMALTLGSELLGHCRSPAVAPSPVLGGSFPLPVEKENKDSIVGVGWQHESVAVFGRAWVGKGGLSFLLGLSSTVLELKCPFIKR